MKLKPKSTVKNPKALLYKRFINLEKSENFNTVYRGPRDDFWIFDAIDNEFIQVNKEEILADSKIVTIYTNSVYYYKNSYFMYDTRGRWGYFNISPELLSTSPTIDIRRDVVGNSRIFGEITDFHILLYNRSYLRLHTNKQATFRVKVYARSLLTQKLSLIANYETTADETTAPNYVSFYLDLDEMVIVENIEYELINNTSESENIQGFMQFQGIEEIDNLKKLGFNNIGKYQTNKYYYSGSFDYIIKGSIEGTTTQYVKGNIVPLTSLNIKFYDDDITLTTDDLVVIDGHLYSVENPETVYKQQPKPFKIHFATLNNML